MSVISSAEKELRAINFGEEDSKVMLSILHTFFDQWDSGGAVWAAAPVLRRLINGQPLSSLTGGGDEWNEVDGKGLLQNNRCSTVFKDADGRAYDIDVDGRPAITFPYDPTTKDPPDPVVVLRT